MKSEVRFDGWKLGLVASLVANAILLTLWLNAARAQSAQGPEEVSERVIVVTATSGLSIVEATATPTQTALLIPTMTETPEAPAPETATLTATMAPATPTATPATTEPPSPTPTTEPTLLPTPSWLGYLNQFRSEANLEPVSEEVAWSLGSEAHSRYTVKADVISHSEDSSSPWYTQAGYDAARNGNLAATVWYEAPPEWAIDYWISAPFHALPMLDPQLVRVGFGWYREQDGGTVFAANMDILRGLNQELVDIAYPIMFPRDGGRAWVRQSVLYEYPDPLTGCPGYVKPTGPPIILQVGTGKGTPALGGSSFRSGENVLDHCTFSETTYTNPDNAAQQSGRRILDVRDAIVLIPRAPLQPDRTYTASIIVDGQQYTWTFTAVAGP